MIRAALVLSLLAAPAWAEPARVVALGGTVAEIAAALGAADLLVARDSTTSFPESLTTLPDVGYVRALSSEGVLSVNPDLILAEAGAGPVETVEVLKASGVDYITVPDSFAPDGIAQKITVIGAALGRETQAETLAAQVTAGLTEARSAADAVAEKKRVLFILSLQGGRVMAGGEGSSAEAIIALAGGVNAATGFQGYKPMTDEAILAAAPDAILMMDREGDMAISDADVLALPALAASPAAQSGAIIRMDGLKLLGFGPRTPEAAAELRAALYPQG